MNTKELFKIKAFLGKNNVSDSSRVLVGKDRAYLTECLNVDIDNDFMPHRRKGYDTKVYSGIKLHSFWSNGEFALFVDNGNLMMMEQDGSFPLVKENIGDGLVSYVYVPPVVYLTNGNVIGYIKDKNFIDFVLPEEDIVYKKLMPPGHLIEWFNGRLLVARDNTIYYSDAMFPGIMDERRNFKQFASRITMMAAVENGVWVSEQNRTYFLSGNDIKDSFLIPKENSGAIEGTAVKIAAHYVDKLNATGNVIIWTSPNGVFIGGNDGFLENATKSVYSPGSKNRGRAIIRQNGNYLQYLVTLIA